MSSSLQQKFIDILISTTGSAHIVAVPAIFIKFTGSPWAAIFLAQCIYWSDKGKSKDGTFYKTAWEWNEEIRIPRRSVSRIQDHLQEMGILDYKVYGTPPKTHYKVNFEKLIDTLGEFLQQTEKKQSETIDDEEVNCVKSVQLIVPKVYNQLSQNAKISTIDYDIDYSIEKEGQQKLPAALPFEADLSHPALKTYRHIARLHVPISWRRDVIQAVGSDLTRLLLWEKTITDWIGHGWNKKNIAGMLDCFQKGGIEEKRNGRTKHPPKMYPPGVAGNDDLEIAWDNMRYNSHHPDSLVYKSSLEKLNKAGIEIRTIK